MRSTMRSRPAGGVGLGMIVGSAQGRCRARRGPHSVHLETYAKQHPWADARQKLRRYIEQVEHPPVGVALTQRLSLRLRASSVDETVPPGTVLPGAGARVYVPAKPAPLPAVKRV